jgi:adenosine deaminase
VIARALVVLLVTLAAGSAAVADEISASRRFEEARRDEPSLVAFLRAMPKGGDLHHHFPAGIFAEDALGVAIRRGLFFDPSTSRFERDTAPGRVPANRLLVDDALRYQFLNAASMRGPIEGPAGGHDRFFQTFGVLGSAIAGLDMVEPLVEIVRRARLQNLQYLELQAGIAPQALERVRAAALVTDTPEELPRRLKPQIDDYIVAAREQLDRWEREVADKVGPGPAVEIRYLITAIRTDTDAQLTATVAAGFALSRADRRVVGINLAGPEDHPIAREGFERHMRILDGLWRQFDRPNVSVHAGELNLSLSPVEPMTSRIRRSIELGRARRIGHGVSIGWETDVAGLLQHMRREGIAVEVCPTSNLVILGIEGERHPFSLYRRAGVPLTINTDDEGINRSNLTMEYVRAVRSWSLSYRDVKELVRNSLEYAFLAGPSLFEDRDYRRLRPQFRGLRERGWVPTPEEAKLLAGSDKAAVQLRLERALHEFER